MESFPELSRGPMSIKQTRVKDITIRSEPEAGLIKTRPRDSSSPRRWELIYTNMPESDKEALEQFEDTVCMGSYEFEWEHPITKVVHIVRFAEQILFESESVDIDSDLFKIRFIVDES